MYEYRCSVFKYRILFKAPLNDDDPGFYLREIIVESEKNFDVRDSHARLRLIHEFLKITNIPILLNTSFNTNNVPIVNSPRDAIDTFYRCGIDSLYINNIKVTK